jgi:hypothetical protein
VVVSINIACPEAEAPVTYSDGRNNSWWNTSAELPQNAICGGIAIICETSRREMRHFKIYEKFRLILSI